MKPKNPKTKNNPPTKTASDQDFFQASSTPSMEVRFFQRAQLPVMLLNTGQIFINAHNLVFRALWTSGHLFPCQS